MNQEVKQKWVDALRSGKYEQGSGILRYRDRFCCLGVLCDLYAQDHPEAKWAIGENPVSLIKYYSFDVNEYSQVYYLSPTIYEWAGLDEHNPIVVFQGKKRYLADLNDMGYDFKQIADLIEKNL